MEKRKRVRRYRVKTPLHRIPIGEPVRGDDGRLGLRIKKQGTQVCEIIWLDQIYGLVSRAVND